MSMDKFLRLMVEKGASDLFVTAGVAPSMKVNGTILPLSKTPPGSSARWGPLRAGTLGGAVVLARLGAGAAVDRRQSGRDR